MRRLACCALPHWKSSFSQHYVTVTIILPKCPTPQHRSLKRDRLIETYASITLPTEYPLDRISVSAQHSQISQDNLPQFGPRPVEGVQVSPLRYSQPVLDLTAGIPSGQAASVEPVTQNLAGAVYLVIQQPPSRQPAAT